MYREIIITVAGTAERFAKSLGKPVAKCVYYENDPRNTLLFAMIKNFSDFDRFVIVTGYLEEEVRVYIDTALSEYADRITIVSNPYYREYGSGYSFYLGLMEGLKFSPSEIVFAEGDLFVDKASLDKIKTTDKDIITLNREPITAARSVVLYKNTKGKIKYLYDLGHKDLYIEEPFTAIYNSGQIWKFKDMGNMKEICNSLSETEKQGTNLLVIQKYFDMLKEDEYDSVFFDTWVNCNTVDDYRVALKDM